MSSHLLGNIHSYLGSFIFGTKTFWPMYFWASNIWDKYIWAEDILATDILDKGTSRPKIFWPSLL